VALTMTELDAARDALLRALNTGEKTVAYADRSVTYRSVDEILDALRAIDAQIAAAATTPRPRQWAAFASKGLDS